MELARQAGDAGLSIVGRLLRAETLLHLGLEAEARQTVVDIAPVLTSHPHQVYALYERVVACALAVDGDMAAASAHRQRAERIYDVLRNKPAQIELARSWASVQPRGDASANPRTERQRTASQVLENVSALLMQSSRPELLASGLLDILADAGCVPAAVAVMRDDAGRETTLGTLGTPSLIDSAARTLALGTARGQTVELRVAPPPDLASQATLNSLEFLLGTVRDLERARLEREDRLTLWPDDEIVSDDGSTIATGKMRELLLSARRVAVTNVNVLISGESGTGKEILARAIHTSSARAKKAFVPFNCAAIPRDLLESQLFGIAAAPSPARSATSRA